MAVVAIFGPTASGKSATAVALALRIGGEVVSADSMQVYRGLERITNQPDRDEREGVPHHLIGHVDPREPYDVARYAAEAHAAIDSILARGATPIVVGGSGLYLRAALADMPFPPQVPDAERARIAAFVAEVGPDAAHATLAELDPAAAARIPTGDTRRVVRALELAEAGSSLVADDDALWDAATRHPTRVVGLVVPRPVLHARIDARTPVLLDAGGIDEVRVLLDDPRPLGHTAARAHGVGDVQALLRGEIDRAECERRLATRTRQYAKRQDTWLRRMPAVERIDADRPPTAIAADVAERLQTPPR